jgi:hypothetical protein
MTLYLRNDHRYLDKQLNPVADTLLHFVGESLVQLVAQQMELLH